MEHVSIPFDGSIVFFIPGRTRLADMRHALAPYGLAGCAPKERTDRDALVAAIRQTHGQKDRIIQSRKQPRRNGVEMVAVERDPLHNAYTTDFGAKVLSGRVVTDYGMADRTAIQDVFDQEKPILTAAMVGRTLTNVVESLRGVSLRPGVYWLPRSVVNDFERIAQDVENVAIERDTRIVRVRFPLDETTARVVLEALQEEVQKEVTEIVTDLKVKRLDMEGITKRRERAEAVAEKVQEYAGLLGKSLDGLKNLTELAKNLACAAALQDQDNYVYA